MSFLCGPDTFSRLVASSEPYFPWFCLWNWHWGLFALCNQKVYLSPQHYISHGKWSLSFLPPVIPRVAWHCQGQVLRKCWYMVILCYCMKLKLVRNTDITEDYCSASTKHWIYEQQAAGRLETWIAGKAASSSICRKTLWIGNPLFH